GRPDTLAAGFSVWLVAMLTTVGRSCAERSAKLAGAPRTGTGCGATVVTGFAAGAASADRGRIAARRMLAGLSQRACMTGGTSRSRTIGRGDSPYAGQK